MKENTLWTYYSSPVMTFAASACNEEKFKIRAIVTKYSQTEDTQKTGEAQT